MRVVPAGVHVQERGIVAARVGGELAEEEGKRLLNQSGMNFTTADDMDDAAKKVVQLAG